MKPERITILVDKDIKLSEQLMAIKCVLEIGTDWPKRITCAAQASPAAFNEKDYTPPNQSMRVMTWTGRARDAFITPGKSQLWQVGIKPVKEEK